MESVHAFFMQIEHHVNSRPIVNAIHEFGVAHRDVIMHEATISMMCPGNTNWRGRLSTVGLLIEVACFCKKSKNVCKIKRSCIKQVCRRRSIVLGLPFL